MLLWNVEKGAPLLRFGGICGSISALYVQSGFLAATARSTDDMTPVVVQWQLRGALGFVRSHDANKQKHNADAAAKPTTASASATPTGGSAEKVGNDAEPVPVGSLIVMQYDFTAVVREALLWCLSRALTATAHAHRNAASTRQSAANALSCCATTARVGSVCSRTAR